jgi:hypothetical protein
MVLTNEIEKGKPAKEITTALIMDVISAFDNISQDGLLQTLGQLESPTAM